MYGPPQETAIPDLEDVPREYVKSMVSVDFFAVPTIRFQILYVFLVLAHERRRIVHFAVTAHPTAQWTAQPLREAFPCGILRRAICYGTAIGSSGRISSTK
jgi:hypothetical protein